MSKIGQEPNRSGADLKRDGQASAYLDDELEGTDAEAFEDLLARSPALQDELDGLRKVVAAVGSLGQVKAPADFYDKLDRRLRRRQLLEPKTGGKLAIVTVAFQVLSIVIILTVAALYMMSELDATPARLEHDPMLSDPATGDDLRVSQPR